MSAIIETRGLSRWYGQVVGLNDLTVSLGPGITGLVGPNGAGKSTFLKLMAGEIRPSRGAIAVLGGAPFANRGVFARVGFCPQQDALYANMTGRAFVRFLLRLHGFGAREADQRARRALERTGLGDAMERPCGGYSKGMRQRTKIAQAIAHDPELLILDEPLGGLDPVGRKRMIELLLEMGARGTSVIVSSHVLHEVQSLTPDVLLLHRGRLLAAGPVEEIRDLIDSHPRRVELRARDARRLAGALLSMDDVRGVQLVPDDGRGDGTADGRGDGRGELLRIETTDLAGFQRRLTALAAEGGFGLHSLESSDASLEAVFDYLVG